MFHNLYPFDYWARVSETNPLRPVHCSWIAVHLWSSILLEGDVEFAGECVVPEVGIFVDSVVQGIDSFETDSYFE
jgi:hypothetical protein